ncbi:MAG: hypothetical protein M3458_02140 [Acidobacteriota bacterium]|nr:hypothetical protein [Acidobacteriota bacterium]
MSLWMIFAVGVFVTALLGGGLFYTVMEFREMARAPEKYLPKLHRWSEPNRKVKPAA